MEQLTIQSDRKNEQEMLQQILDNTHKTRNYIKWQLIITVALVIIPLLASLAIVPFVLNSLVSTYGGH